MSDKLTIVGPEPDETEFTSSPGQVNIESLMLMAKYDSAFRKKLLQNREEALNESGLAFTPAEKLILTNIPDEKLEKNIDKFYIPGINEKSLHNWKKAASVILLVTSFMFAGINCSFITATGAEPSQSLNQNRWVDGDTYSVVAIGVPKKNTVDTNKRRHESKEAAKLNAQYQILEKFKGYTLTGTGAMSDYGAKQIDWNNIKSIIKNGEIYRVEWDGKQYCEMIYRVKHKGLKKMIESLY